MKRIMTSMGNIDRLEKVKKNLEMYKVGVNIFHTEDVRWLVGVAEASQKISQALQSLPWKRYRSIDNTLQDNMFLERNVWVSFNYDVCERLFDLFSSD